MTFRFNPFSYFSAPQAAPDASSATSEAGSSGSMPHSAARQALPSRSGLRQGEDPAMPPARRRAGLGTEAGQSRLETLGSDLVQKIALDGQLTAQDVVSMAATSKAMKAASASAWSDLYRRSAAGIAQGLLAVRSLADLRESLALLQNSGLARDRHEQLLTSLDTVIQRLPEQERHAAIEEFVKSVDEFAGPGRNLEDDDSTLMELRRAARHGLGGWERFVTKTHGRPAIHAGENAQDVARRLGVASTRLEEMSAWRGSRLIPAGPAYRAVTESREDFDRILQRFGIVNPEVIALLDAVHKSPEAAVSRGDNVQDVIARFGIRDSNEAFRLAEASVRGPAGQAVSDGMSPEDAERHYGLERSPFMLLRLQRIAEARDARAAEGQSVAGRVLRGTGNLLLGAAKLIIDGVMKDAARAAVRAYPGTSGAGPSGTAAATLLTTALAAHSRIGHVPGGHRRGSIGDDRDRTERALRSFERAVRNLPLRPGQPEQHRRRTDGTDSEED